MVQDATGTGRRSWPPTGTELGRVVIERVQPELDGGRYAVKRVVGDRVHVSADILKDGHDVVAACVCYRAPGEREWRRAALEFAFDEERWHGEIQVDSPGIWNFSVEAWPDPFATWRADLRKRLDAEQDVASELLEGAALLHQRARSSRGERAERIAAAHTQLKNERLSLEHRLEVAFSESVAKDMEGPQDEASVTRHAEREIIVDRPLAVFGNWYELFPRSCSGQYDRHGTFRDAERHLPRLAKLGFNVIYLPPIHPIGVSKRKGRNNNPQCEPGDVGSPWAIGGEEGGHDAVHPELGTLADFEAYVAAAARYGIELALDFALQCSPDHPWIHEHPEWFFVRPDGTLRYAENPPKKYEDIYPLNFWCDDRVGLWTACRDLILFWIDHGIRIFRVDNPHTKPFAFWQWCLREVRHRHPDVIFLAEAFTRPKRMRNLAKLGFSQSYTYFTWKNAKDELAEYVSELAHSEMAEYYRPNFFANTPDILHEYLQHGGRAAFRVRLLLAATLSPTYGIYSGFELCENVPLRPGSEEYLNSEKYELRVRDYDAPGNLNDEVALLNRLRAEHPALQRLSNVQFLGSDSADVIAFCKLAEEGDLIVVANLDPHDTRETMIDVPLAALGIGPQEPFFVTDLLTGERYTWQGPRAYIRLDPRDKVGHLLRIERSQ
ncbi:MAG: alpha-1,4-glucan--maltose-1-phosphate maltosyltransferase [Polyangiaceae bacterium]